MLGAKKVVSVSTIGWVTTWTVLAFARRHQKNPSHSSLLPVPLPATVKASWSQRKISVSRIQAALGTRVSWMSKKDPLFIQLLTRTSPSSTWLVWRARRTDTVAHYELVSERDSTV